MTLLVAGPAGLDSQGLLSGSGLLAAISAAPLARVQLWSRTGTLAPAIREILSRRDIDVSGVDFSGSVPVVAADGQSHDLGGSAIGSYEPTSADGLTAVLIIGLGPADGVQALHAARGLQAPILILADGQERDRHRSATSAAASEQVWDLRIESLPEALRLTGTSDILAAARGLQSAGSKAVVVTAGMLGGLLVYGDRAITYPGQPVERTHVQPGTFAVFAGALAGWCAGAGADFTALKRGCATASVVAAIQAAGGPKRLLTSDRAQYLERFNRLRRTAKY